MSNQSAAANLHPFMRTSSAPDPDTADQVPIMRREITLLRIEMEQLRGKEDETRKIKEFLRAYVEQVEDLRANRDQWQREAERLSALIRANQQSAHSLRLLPAALFESITRLARLT
jgi:FtsZ-binding cell division protein ZapB